MTGKIIIYLLNFNMELYIKLYAKICVLRVSYVKYRKITVFTCIHTFFFIHLERIKPCTIIK